MDVIDIAKEFAVTQQVEELDATYYTFIEEDLQAFVERIEQPHMQKIAEFERALQAAQFSAGVADDLLADLKHAKQKIEQLREALHRAEIALKRAWEFVPLDSTTDDAVFAARVEAKKILEQTK